MEQNLAPPSRAQRRFPLNLELDREEFIEVVMKRTNVTLDDIARHARSNRTSVFFWKRGVTTRNSKSIDDSFEALTQITL